MEEESPKKFIDELSHVSSLLRGSNEF